MIVSDTRIKFEVSFVNTIAAPYIECHNITLKKIISTRLNCVSKFMCLDWKINEKSTAK